MPSARSIAHELAIAARLAARAVRRRLSGTVPPAASDAGFRSTLEPWLASLPPDTCAGHAFHWLPATEPPWHDTGIDL
ncbi:MAG: hypothetical protein NDI84_11195, partial [Steroidobacteraceae bacterium]|nr:hypothetical protein [Steroidobacteraceae bacterium]